MDRRYFMKVSSGAMGTLLPIRARAPVDLATPTASPVPFTATWAIIERTFKATDAPTTTEAPPFSSVTVWIEFRSFEPDVREQMEKIKQRLLTLSTDYHVNKEIEGASTFGDESYAVRGGLGPETEAVWIGSRVGRFLYSIGVFGDESDEFEQFASDTIAALVKRAELNDAYSEEALAALLPTEDDIGLTVSEERYHSGEYTPKSMKPSS